MTIGLTILVAGSRPPNDDGGRPINGTTARYVRSYRAVLTRYAYVKECYSRNK